MRRSIFVAFVVVILLLCGMVTFAISGHEAGSANPPASTSATVKATIDVYQWYDVDVTIPNDMTNQTLIATNPNVYNPQPTQFVFSVTHVYSNSATVDVAVSISNGANAGTSGLGNFENSLKPKILSFEYAAYRLIGNGPGSSWELYGSWQDVEGGTTSNNTLNYMPLAATQNDPGQNNGNRYYMAARFVPEYGAPAGKYPIVFTIHFQATVTFP